MRIGVRSKSQRQGIGRQLMDFLFEKFPRHLALDVSTDNAKAVNFYKRVGLVVTDTYLSEEKVEFNKFETPVGFVHVKREYMPIMNSEGKKFGCAAEAMSKDISSAGKKSESDDDTLVSESEIVDSQVAQPTVVMNSGIL